MAIFWQPHVYMSRFRDHWNLCPRSLCDAALAEPVRKQLSCEAGIDLGYKQKATLDFAGLGKGLISEMSVEYVIFRDRVHFNNPKTLTSVDCKWWQPSVHEQCFEFVKLVDRAGWNATLQWSKEGDPEGYFNAAMKLIRGVPPKVLRVPEGAVLLPGGTQIN